jgi:hypothetical protein
MEEREEKKEEASDHLSRRRFLKGCAVTLLTTTSYQIISILSDNGAQAGLCDAGCVNACVTNCTSCTTVNCMSGNVPEPPPPTCVQNFKS